MSAALINALKNARYDTAAIKTNLKEALVAISNPAKNFASKLESVTLAYDRENPDAQWPDFLFPFADPVEDAPLPPDQSGASAANLQEALDKVDALAELIRLALPVETQPGPTPTIASMPPVDVRDGWFALRCVFERPNCGPLEPPIISEPTLPFQLANFFDPDAPARPIRIALPMDTSPAGLRKFDKNAAFMISDMLCGQIDRFRALSFGDLIRSVLPFPLHKDLSVPDSGPCKTSGGLQMGMICTFSLPIITICALILLIIIVTLLDIIFRWLPFFTICFPLPGFKAKK